MDRNLNRQPCLNSSSPAVHLLFFSTPGHLGSYFSLAMVYEAPISTVSCYLHSFFPVAYALASIVSYLLD